MAEIVVKQKNIGTTVSARVGDSLRVELPENPTTGFRWVPAELNAGIVDLRADDFLPVGGTAVGAGGVRVFRFHVKGTGSSRLQFKLSRAWESGVPSQLFEIQIDVS